jgi:hypothetical protein
MKHTILISLLAAAILAGPCRSEPMKLVVSSPLAKVLRASVPDVSAASDLRMDGAPGETISAQVVLMPGDKPDTVGAQLSALKCADGKSSIPARAARLQWVRYLDITANSPNVPLDELVAKAPVSIPDPFWEDAERPVEPGSPQPLWIELDVPADTPAGEYRGELTVAGRVSRCSVPVSVRVRGFRLMDKRHQRVIQWWDVPGHGFEQLKPGTEAYWKHLEGMCALVRRHRQTDVRADWGLIARTADGSGWDTSLFEKFVDIAFGAGLQAVQFTAAGRHTKPQLEPGSTTEAIEDNIGRLAAVQQLVVKRRWQGRVFTSLADEPFIVHEKSYKALLKRVREVAPDVGVIEAIETDDIGDIDIFVPKLSHLNLWWPRFEEMKRQGKEIWFYTCCHPQGRYPNRFLDEPLVGARELHWISYLYGLDGYLHWGLNWFTPGVDPYTEKGANQWALPPGDAQVAYPGKDGFVGSLRLSAMRDGLQDYEYLWTLENRLRALKAHIGASAGWLDPRQRPLELCRRVVQSFYDHTRDPKVLLDTRATIADEIEGLDAVPLLYVQTSPPEGTITPAGPITINVRGLAAPGAKIAINDQPVIEQNTGADGSFVGMVFITSEKPEIVVTAELNGVTRTAKRVFVVKE